MFSCLIESSSFGGLSDIFSWLDYASWLEYYLSDCVPLKVSHLETPNIHLSLINDTNYDYLAKGSSSFYMIEFYFFPHTHTFLINSKYRY